MENTSDSFMPGSLLFCMKSKKSVCYSVADNTDTVVSCFLHTFLLEVLKLVDHTIH